ELYDCCQVSVFLRLGEEPLAPETGLVIIDIEGGGPGKNLYL
ncbi:MAG: hypothetical protein JWQ57_3891, partial [Mucilaginibacter sp.]|nr:hypothetical protein [Mucilaginibacter sp.]